MQIKNDVEYRRLERLCNVMNELLSRFDNAKMDRGAQPCQGWAGTPNERAYHEAGHAVAGIDVGMSIEFARIKKVGLFGGAVKRTDTKRLGDFCRRVPQRYTLSHVELDKEGEELNQQLTCLLGQEMEYLMAGVAAETIMTGTDDVPSVSQMCHALADFKSAFELIQDFPDEGVLFICRGYIDALQRLQRTENWQAVTAIANCLLRQKRVDRRDLLKLFQATRK